MISLRPQGDHAGVRGVAARVGARVLACSTLRLEARPSPALGEALSCDTVVFTSPAAVRFAGQAHGGLRARKDQHWLAVGTGSARELKRLGLRDVRIPSRMDAEGLLGLPELEACAGRRIGLVTAPGGRNLIEPELLARGATVIRADVYERRALPLRRLQLERLATLSRPAVLLASSTEALAGLLEQLPETLRRRVLEDPIVVSSHRLALYAAAAGFRDVHQAAGPQSASLVHSAADAVRRGFG